MSRAKRVLPLFVSISSEYLRNTLHQFQIDTTRFRFKNREKPGFQSQGRSGTRTAVTIQFFCYEPLIGRSTAVPLLSQKMPWRTSMTDVVSEPASE
jgi:hypothetical protein